MLIAGIVVSVFGVLLALGGLVQKNKAKKILAAPFKKTGEIASNPRVAGPKGEVSCEGAIRVQQPILSPCSNQPCVYYELKVEKQVEESKMTDRGMQTQKNWKEVSQQKQGQGFYLDDGSGPVGVDAAQGGLDADLQQSYQGAPPGGAGLGVLANLLTGALFAHGERVLQYRATEKIIPAQGNLFVMGQLRGGIIAKSDGMSGRLIASRKGREGLVGSVNKMATILFVVGGLAFVGGIPVMFMKGPHTNPCKPDHATITNALDEQCTGAMKSSEEKFDWKVTKAGVYQVDFKQPEDATVSSWPTIVVETPDGFPMNNPFNLGISDQSIKVDLPKGDYELRIFGVDGSKLDGGFRYVLGVKYVKALDDDDKQQAAKSDDDDDDKGSAKKKKSKDD